ncbi:MAG: hypothetical protein ABFD97_09440 [Syntrophobacter sp.]
MNAHPNAGADYSRRNSISEAACTQRAAHRSWEIREALPDRRDFARVTVDRDDHTDLSVGGTDAILGGNSTNTSKIFHRLFEVDWGSLDNTGGACGYKTSQLHFKVTIAHYPIRADFFQSCASN